MVPPLVRDSHPFDDSIGMHGPALLDLVIRIFGEGCIYWDMAVLRQALADHYKSRPGPIAFGRLLGARALKQSERFWTDHRAFEKISLALSGHPVEGEVQQAPIAEEILMGVLCAEEVRPGIPYAQEVRAYIASCLRFDSTFVLDGALEEIAGTQLDTLLSDDGFEPKWREVLVKKTMKCLEAMKPEQIRAQAISEDTVPAVEILQASRFLDQARTRADFEKLVEMQKKAIEKKLPS